MIGRAPPGTEVVRPVRGGVVADFEATEQLLRALLKQAGVGFLRRPRMVVCVPSGTSEAERRAVQESARAAGAGRVSLVTSPIAAALGAGLPVMEAVASMIVDVGGGCTHVAVTSLGGMVVQNSVAVAGDALDAAIAGWLRRAHSLVIGERTAENLKVRVGSLTPDVHSDLRMRIRGRDTETGRPGEVELTSADLAMALVEPIGEIREAVMAVLRNAPPEVSADIMDRGLLLCGGSSHLRGLDSELREATGLPVLQAEHPDECVARGAGMLLEDALLLDRVADVH